MRDDPGLCWKSLTEQLMAASNISIDKLCLKDEGREVELFRSIPAQMKEFYPSKVRQILKISIPVDCQRQQPACKHALKAEIRSEGTKKAGRLERQLVKKKAVTHLRAGGSFMDNQCLGFCC